MVILRVTTNQKFAILAAFQLASLLPFVGRNSHLVQPFMKCDGCIIVVLPERTRGNIIVRRAIKTMNRS